MDDPIRELNKLSDEISFLKRKLERIGELARIAITNIDDWEIVEVEQKLNEIIKLSSIKSD